MTVRVSQHGGVNLDHKLSSVLLVVGRRLLQEVPGDLPVVGVQPLDDTRLAQGFQAPDVGLDMPLDVTAGNALGQPGDLGVLARLVEPLVAGCQRGDGLVRRSCRRLPADREDSADAGILGQQRCVELEVVYAGINPVDDQVGLVGQPVAGEALAPEMAGNGRSRHLGS